MLRNKGCLLLSQRMLVSWFKPIQLTSLRALSHSIGTDKSINVSPWSSSTSSPISLSTTMPKSIEGSMHPTDAPDEKMSMLNDEKNMTTPPPNQVQQEYISTLIRRAETKNDHKNIIQYVQIARTKGLKLNSAEYMAGLRACTKVRDISSLEAFEIYKLMQSEDRPVPLVAFSYLLQVCSWHKDSERAMEVGRNFLKLGYQPNQEFLMSILLCLAHDRVPRSKEIDSYYEQFLALPKDRRDRGLPSAEEYRDHTLDKRERVFTDVAKAYSRSGRVLEVSRVLQDMADSKITPSVSLCHYILENALFNSDHGLLLHLTKAYLHANVRLERGVVTRILQIAAATADATLSVDCLQLLKKSGFELKPLDVACWARACVSAGDLAGAVEALMEAEARGFDLLAGERYAGQEQASSNETCVCGSELQDGIVKVIGRSTRRLDELYYALVDLARGDFAAPRIALNAIIISAGNMGSIDRAFATFQEYSSLFGHTPDVHTYNALLSAASRVRGESVHAVLAVFQDMESAGIQPNGFSFSILIEAMAEAGDLQGFGEVSRHMIERGVRSHPRALRKMAVSAARGGAWEVCESAVQMLQNQDGAPPPRFLMRRLDGIRAQEKQKPAPSEEVKSPHSSNK